MADKLIVLSGKVQMSIRDQLDVCNEVLCTRWDMNAHEDVMDQVIDAMDKRPKYGFPVKDARNIHVLSSRRHDRSEHAKKSFGEWLRELMQDDDIDEVLIPSPRPLDASQVIKWLKYFPTITIANAGISYRQGADIDDVQRVRAVILGEKTTEDGNEILKQEWPGGRPPLGTATNEGALVKSEDFGDVRSTLQQVRYDDISIARAADELGCARKTITNILEERAELYNLPKQ